jgi:predicted Zn-dependent peptidase
MKKIILPLFFCSPNRKSTNEGRGCKYFHPENGMKVLVVEDFSIPNANMYLFYKVGSRNEYQGITGLSHFF